jgi:hypothetical protein
MQSRSQHTSAGRHEDRYNGDAKQDGGPLVSQLGPVQPDGGEKRADHDSGRNGEWQAAEAGVIANLIDLNRQVGEVPNQAWLPSRTTAPASDGVRPSA